MKRWIRPVITTYNCSLSCDKRSSRKREKESEKSSIKKAIAVKGGKGGVGKSLVTSLLAVNMQRKGYQTAILDADLTGPSIPRAFGITQKPTQANLGYSRKDKDWHPAYEHKPTSRKDSDP